MTRRTTFHNTRCVDGRVMRHDPPSETDIGQCEECRGAGCDRERMEKLLAEFFEPAHGDVCESCGQAAPDASDDGEGICADCAQNRAEAAYERQCEAFHGGDGPMTLREQQIAAWRLK